MLASLKIFDEICMKVMRNDESSWFRIYNQTTNSKRYTQPSPHILLSF